MGDSYNVRYVWLRHDFGICIFIRRLFVPRLCVSYEFTRYFTEIYSYHSLNFNFTLLKICKMLTAFHPLDILALWNCKCIDSSGCSATQPTTNGGHKLPIPNAFVAAAFVSLIMVALAISLNTLLVIYHSMRRLDLICELRRKPLDFACHKAEADCHVPIVPDIRFAWHKSLWT